MHVWFAREPAESKTEQGQREPAREAGRGREATRERSASNRTFTLREMVTSTPGILLLPMLICLQHCVDVHGKSLECVSVRVCVFFVG